MKNDLRKVHKQVFAYNAGLYSSGMKKLRYCDYKTYFSAVLRDEKPVRRKRHCQNAADAGSGFAGNRYLKRILFLQTLFVTSVEAGKRLLFSPGSF